MIEGAAAVVDGADPGLPLVALDTALSPIRRVVGYALAQPASVSYFEANVGRWLTPLLALEVPDPIREALVALAGQVSGFDADEIDGRRDRLARMRQVVVRLDALLGLPLAPQERRPRRERRRSEDDAPRDASAPPADDERPPREKKRGKRDRRDRDREPAAVRPSAPPPSVALDAVDDLDIDALLEIDDDEDEDGAGASATSGEADEPLAALGLAPELLTALHAAGLHTAGDLLWFAPAEIEDVRPIHGAGREIPPGRVAVGGRLGARFTVCEPSGARRIEARMRGAGAIRLSWSPGATASWWLDRFGTGEKVVVVGTWDGSRLLDPTWVFDAGRGVRIVRYGVPGVDDHQIQAVLHLLFARAQRLRDPLPAAVRGRHLSLLDALAALHGRGDTTAGRARLAFDEALAVSLGHAWTRLGAQKARGLANTVMHARVTRLLQSLEVGLDDAQELAFDDIRRDLRRNRPMRRVLLGPPGGRKGLIALLTAVMVADGKCQVLWVGSDPQIAEQRFSATEPLLRELGLNARLAPDNPNAGVRDALKRGEIHVLFGTDALLAGADPLEFRRLGLVISSERARLGAVSDRVEELKAPKPDLLVVPVAPPSAEVLLGAWASHDLTSVPGAPAPDVELVSFAERDGLYAQARSVSAAGGQVAVLFPQIGGADAYAPTEARAILARLAEGPLAGLQIALSHGSMSRDERKRVLADFNHRRLDGLVATGPLEDGPPVPGLSMAIVEDAHRMDPLRLSRLCGLGVARVGLVVADDTPEVRREELRSVVRGERALPASADGGHPLPAFRFVNPRADGALLIEARSAAVALLTADSALRASQHADLLRAAHAAWARLMPSPCPLPEPGEPSALKRRRRRRRRR